jgi:hypothetical protein
MIMDKRVIDWCESHKLCRGCKFNCVAPVADWKFDEWIKNQERLVLERLESTKKDFTLKD